MVAVKTMEPLDYPNGSFSRFAVYHGSNHHLALHPSAVSLARLSIVSQVPPHRSRDGRCRLTTACPHEARGSLRAAASALRRASPRLRGRLDSRRRPRHTGADRGAKPDPRQSMPRARPRWPASAHTEWRPAQKGTFSRCGERGHFNFALTVLLQPLDDSTKYLHTRAGRGLIRSRLVPQPFWRTPDPRNEKPRQGRGVFLSTSTTFETRNSKFRRIRPQSQAQTHVER